MQVFRKMLKKKFSIYLSVW